MRFLALLLLVVLAHFSAGAFEKPQIQQAHAGKLLEYLYKR